MPSSTAPPRGERSLSELVIGIKGAGEMASGIAWRLWRAGFRRQFLMELPSPTAVRRRVSYSEAVYDGRQAVEGVAGVRIEGPGMLEGVWVEGAIGVLVDPAWSAVHAVKPDVLVDAILAKRNLGTRLDDAPLVIALGPGFAAGVDAHVVIGTNRGHHLGRIYTEGGDEPNTGIPGAIAGRTYERVVRAPCGGPFVTALDIGDRVAEGDEVGAVNGRTVHAALGGVLRGLIRPGTEVEAGFKLADIDPRGNTQYCALISDKARAIAGSVLEAILRVYNDSPPAPRARLEG